MSTPEVDPTRPFDPSQPASPDGFELNLIPESNRYQVLEVLKEGGMGIVFLARDRQLNRTVAYKRLKEKYAQREDLKRRLFQEAQVTAQLQHKGIPPVYSVGIGADGLAFYAMRLIRGVDYYQTLDSFHRKLRAGQLSPTGPEFRAMIGALVAACQAAAYAHTKGVLHRDIKPANIMIGRYGESLLVDWGLAGALLPEEISEGPVEFPDSGSGSETRPGSALGTYPYMSPEQARGDNDALTNRTDVFGLGATLYAVLAGRPPYVAANSADHVALAREHRFEKPSRWNPAAPSELEAVCLKAMAFAPADRYEDGDDLAADLQRWLDGEPTRALPDSFARGVSRRVARNPGQTLLAVLAVLLITALAIGFLAYRQQARARIVQLGREQALAELDRLPEVSSAALTDQLKRLRESPFAGDLTEELRGRLAEASRAGAPTLRWRAALNDVTGAGVDSVVDEVLKVPAGEIPALVAPFLKSPGPLMEAARARQEQGVGSRIEVLRLCALMTTLGVAPAQRGALIETALEPLLDVPVGEAADAARVLAGLGPDFAAAIRRRFETATRESDQVALATLIAETTPVTTDRIGLFLDADVPQLPILRTKLRGFDRDLRAEAETVLRRWPEYPASLKIRDPEVRRIGNAAAALASLGDLTPLDRLLKRGPDPRLRYWIARVLEPCGVSAASLMDKLGRTTEPDIRRMLLLALGEYSDRQLGSENGQRLDRMLAEWFRSEPDGGLHSTCDWLLRKRGREAEVRRLAGELAVIPESEPWRRCLAGIAEARQRGAARSGWYVVKGADAGEGAPLTMIVLPAPGVVTVGSPPDEVGRTGRETLRRSRIDWGYSLAATEVTQGGFLKRNPSFPLPTRPIPSRPTDPLEGAGHLVATKFCNEISKGLGIRPAYRELRDTRDGPVTGVDPAARESSSVGFRLPTAPEWETACRAECATIRPFSNEPGVFNRCAQYLLSTERPAPVGTAWPDDNGLFDMLGNALELVNSEMPGDDTPATWDPATVPVRTVSLRGGNWVNREYFIRPAMVTGAALVSPVIVGAGFRLARTETIR